MSPTDSEALSPAQQPGFGLRQAREAAGVSLSDLAKQTLIAPHRLKALERDDYDAAGGATYVKGYARAYARALNLDPAETVRLFEEQLEPAAQPEVATARLPNKREHRQNADFSAQAAGFFTRAITMAQQHKRGVLGAVLVLLIALVLLVFSREGEQPGERVMPPELETPVKPSPESQLDSIPLEPAAPEAEPRRPVPGMAPDPDDTPGESDDSTASLATDDPPSASADALVSDQASASSSAPGSAISSSATITATPSPAAVEDTRTLEFRFTDACWLEVVDANGERIIAREAQSGDNLRLSGSAPFRIVLGNAPAASIAIDGEPVDIKPRSSTNVLRLSLGGDS